MKIREKINLILKHPLGALYGALLGIVAFFAALPMLVSGMWDAALVDLVMAAILIALMLKKSAGITRKNRSLTEKIAAWSILIAADILALLPTNNFPGNLSTAIAFSLVICAFAFYFGGALLALYSVVPALWCCVFMPYHEEFMLLLSFPLRLSATVLSAGILNLCGAGVVHAGTSLNLPGVNIAITDACSGIKQLDAFILIAFIVVEMLHKKSGWKFLHFAFIIPAIIIGNSLRIVITVLLYRQWGEVILGNSWHTALGYVQIVLALLIFLVVGRIFLAADKPKSEEPEV